MSTLIIYRHYIAHRFGALFILLPLFLLASACQPKNLEKSFYVNQTEHGNNCAKLAQLIEREQGSQLVYNKIDGSVHSFKRQANSRKLAKLHNLYHSNNCAATGKTPAVGLDFKQCFEYCQQLTKRSNEQCFDACK